MDTTELIENRTFDEIAIGESLVEMGRIGVAGDGGEEFDVAPGDRPLE